MTAMTEVLATAESRLRTQVDALQRRVPGAARPADQAGDCPRGAEGANAMN